MVEQYLTYFAPGGDWHVIALVASMLIVTVYGLFLGIARAFNLNELERFSKAEILNAIATVLMVMVLITFLNQLENFLITQFIGGDVSFRCGGEEFRIGAIQNPEAREIAARGHGERAAGEGLTSSIDLLKCRLKDKAEAFANIQQQITASAGSIFDLLNVYLSVVGIPIFQGSMIGSWFKEAESLRLINHLVTVLLIGINSAIIVADYAKYTMLAFYLPVGLILRSVPYTRGIGAFFMSLAIGLYFIYPTLYIITDPGFIRPTYNPPQLDSATPACYPTFSGVVHSVYSSSLGGVSSGGSDLTADQLRSDVSSVYTSILLQPFIVFAITMIMVRYMMYILGGEPQDLLRATMKLV